MKKRTIILFMALSSLSVTSKAQWTVIDPHEPRTEYRELGQ